MPHVQRIPILLTSPKPSGRMGRNFNTVFVVLFFLSAFFIYWSHISFQRLLFHSGVRILYPTVKDALHACGIPVGGYGYIESLCSTKGRTCQGVAGECEGGFVRYGCIVVLCHRIVLPVGLPVH